MLRVSHSPTTFCLVLMEGEILNLVRTWTAVAVAASLCYCHAAAKMASPGPTRLLAFLPVMGLFQVLPMGLTTVLLCGPTSFFVSWLATFKLALFALRRGPLHSHPPLPLPRFLLLACFPVKIRAPDDTNPPKRQRSRVNAAVKLLIYATNFPVHRMRDRIHPRLFMLLFSVYTYIAFEAILAASARLARAWLGVDLEPQFHEPYLSTSLQDFWGRRWNLAASRVLRPAVYEPVRAAAGPLPAVAAAFLVSGIMHEVIFFHLGREWPTWDVTCFFALHGVCVAAEIGAKRAVRGRWRPPPAVSGALATGFVAATALWLFWPAMMRFGAEERGNGEILAAVEFVSELGRGLFDFGESVYRRFAV